MRDPSLQVCPILRSKLQAVGGQRLLGGRAALYQDHIRLRGWSLQGRYDRCVGLSEVERVDWYVDGVPRVLIGLRQGEEISLAVRGAALWRLTLEDLRGRACRSKPLSRKGVRYRHQVLYTDELLPGGDGMMVSPAAVAARTDRT